MSPLRSLRLLILLALAACSSPNPGFVEPGMMGADAAGPAPECADDSACSEERPVCEVAEALCRGCSTDDECARIDSGAPVCGDDGRCVVCTDSSQCGDADAPICDADLTCRGCTTDDECIARDPRFPTCGDTGACQGCTWDGECPSGVCRGDGMGCALHEEVVHVDPAQTASADCGSLEMSCATIAVALSKANAGRPYVKLAPERYYESVSLAGVDHPIFLIGHRSAPSLTSNLSAPSSIHEPLDISISSDVNIRDLAMFATTNNRPSLTITSSNVNLSYVVVAGSKKRGIHAVTSTVDMVGVRVWAATLVGIYLDRTRFNIAHSVVDYSGSSTVSGEGSGIRVVGQHPTETGASSIEYTTLTNNRAATAGGIYCQGASAVVQHNVIWGNEPAGQPQVSQGTSGCTFKDNLLQGGSGNGNVSLDPKFEGGYAIYELQAGSPAIDQGVVSEPGVRDIFKRPRDHKPDYGAHEYIP